MSYKRHRKYKAGANVADLFLDLFLLIFVRPIERLFDRIKNRKHQTPPDRENTP